MTMSPDKPPELFSPERPVRSDFARGVGIPYAVRRMITVAVLLGILGSGGMWMWGHFSTGPDQVPVIKADGSYKQRPEQPGGIDIPHQDVQVYKEIDGSVAAAGTKPLVEHMLPPPEQPLPSAIAPKRSMVDTDKSGQMESLIAKAISSEPLPQDVTAVPMMPKTPKAAPAPIVIPVAPVAEAPTPAPEAAPMAAVSPEPVAENPAVALIKPAPVVTEVKPASELKPVAAPKSLTPPKTVPAPAVTKSAELTKGNVVIQLAASTDQASAKNNAEDLQGKYQSILGAAKLHIVRADLAKGTYFRVQSPPMSEAQATSMCAAIKNAHGGCIIVRR